MANVTCINFIPNGPSETMPHISTTDLRRLQAVQQLLLSPPQSNLDAWANAVCEAARPLFRTDHVYYLEPDASPTRTSSTRTSPTRTSSAPSAAPDKHVSDKYISDDSASTGDGSVSEAAAPSLSVHCASGGPDFEAGIRRHFQGFEDGFSTFLEDYPTMQHRVVRSAGAGAYHDAPIYDATARERLRIYQEVFRPAGIQRQIALSAPLPQGEAMLITGHPYEDVPGYGGMRHELMRLLVPAFEAGLRFRRRLQAVHGALHEAFDHLPTPLLVFGPNGSEQHRNTAFRALSQTTLNTTALVHQAQALARTLLCSLGEGPSGKNAESAPAQAQTSVGNYRLSGYYDWALFSGPAVLVSVERSRPLPTAEQVTAATGLTPRQSEVALRMAQGDSDQEIADRLFISVHTARRHSAAVLKGLDVTSRAGVALALIKQAR